MSKSVRTGAVGIVLALLLAGCTSSEEGAKGKQQATAPPPPSADEGQIHGFVLDESELPVEGAEVGLLDVADFQPVRTDGEGAFFISGLKPGTYKIGVQKLGFQADSKRVEVTAGGITPMEFKLKALDVTLTPYSIVLIGEGYIACGAYILGVVTVSNLNVCPWDAQHKPRFEFSVAKAGLMGIMQEVTWRKSSALTSEKLIVYLWYKPVCNPTCSSEASYAEANDPSPIRLYADLDSEDFAEDPVPLASMTFVGGEGQELVIVYQQRITHYITAFYNVHGDLAKDTSLPPE